MQPGKYFRLLLITFACLFATVASTAASDYGNLDINLRTFYFSRDRANGIDPEAFTQGLMLRYHSPYFADMININSSFFANWKLIGENNRGGTGLLNDKADGRQSSYNKVGEIYTHIILPYDATFVAGRKQIDTPLLNDSDSRGTPSSTQLAMLNFNFLQTDFYAAISNGGVSRTDTSFSRYKDANGDNFEVYVIGAEGEFDNAFKYHFAAGYAPNVLKQIYFNAEYPWHFSENYSILFSGYQYFGWADGDGTYSDDGSGYSSSLSNLAVRFSIFDAKLLFGYQKIHGDTYSLSWDDLNSDATDYGTWNSVTRLNFIRSGEESWQARIDYNLSNYLEGLSVMTRYVTGHGIKRDSQKSGSEWERDIEISYKPTMLPNLAFRWRNAYAKSIDGQQSSENRFILNYTVKY